MSTAATWALRIGIAVAVLSLIVFAALAWVVGTTAGARWAFDRADGLLDAELEIAAIEGTLASRLGVRDLYYAAADASLKLRAERLSIDVDLAQLIHGVLWIDNAELVGVSVTMRDTPQTPPAERASTASPLLAPIDVIVESLSARDIEVTRQGEAVLNAHHAKLAGRWVERRIAIESLQVNAQQGEIAVAGQVQRRREDYVIDARGRFDWRAGQQRIAGELLAATENGRIALSVELTAPTAAELTASIAQTPRHPWTFELHVPRFDPEAQGLVRLDSLAASLTGSGTGFQGAIRGEVLVNGEPVRLAPLRMSRVARGLRFDASVEIGNALRDLSATGTIVLDEEPWQATLAVHWESLTLPSQWVGRPLRTRGEARLEGNFQRFSIDADMAFGPPQHMADILLEASGSSEDIRVGELRVQQSDGLLTASGRLQREPTFSWDLHMTAQSFNPGAFAPQWPGALDFMVDTQGRVTGSGLRGELVLEHLRGRLRGRAVSGSANLQLTSEQRLVGRAELQSGASRVRVLADRGAPWNAQVYIDIASLEDWLPRGSGSLEGRFTLAGEWPHLNLAGSAYADELRIAGAQIDTAWIEVDATDLSAPQGSARINIEEIAVGGITLNRVVARVAGSQQQHTMEVRASGAPGSVDLRITGRREVENGEERFIETLRRVSLDPADLQPLTLTEPSRFVITPSAWRLSSTCLASTEARICIHGRVGRGTSDVVPIDAELQAIIPDIAVATVLTEEIADLHGRVMLDVGLEGTLADPAWRLQAQATEITAEIPRLGLELRDGELSATSRDRGEIVVSGGLRSGKGRLTVTGTVTPSGHADLDIEGERVLAADMAGARVVVTPDLAFSRSEQGMRLHGQLRIPTAQINVQQLQGVTRLERGSDDVVIIGAKTQKESRVESIPLRADINVVLGEDITVRGFGLDARLDGQVQVREAPGQPTMASGEIHVEGGYRAFGQDLSIEQGRILYAETPLDDPRLNIVAVREVDMEDITAGVRITGSAQTPRLTVFSDPAMDEANALSYLLSGRPLEDIGVSESDADALSSAAESLGTAAGGFLGKRIGARLGLDVAAVEEEELTEAQVFTVGEYLSPRLYLGYGFGLFDAGDVITLRYRLSDEVAVRAIRGPEESRIGIEYRIEK